MTTVGLPVPSAGSCQTSLVDDRVDRGQQRLKVARERWTGV